MAGGGFRSLGARGRIGGLCVAMSAGACASLPGDVRGPVPGPPGPAHTRTPSLAPPTAAPERAPRADQAPRRPPPTFSPTAAAPAGPTPRAREIKIAVLGDTGMRAAFRRNLRSILAEEADVVVHVGDFDYEDDPEGFWGAIDHELGHEFPYFLALGNHDTHHWPEYAAHMLEHMSQNDVTLDDLGLDDEMYTTEFRSVRLAVVGQGRDLEGYDRFVHESLEPNAPSWALCAWHKNQTAMQLGRKRDEMGWAVYETCRLAGAIIVTGHEHSYERTKTLLSMQLQLVDPLCARPDEVCVGPGRSFAVVQGLGGYSIRAQRRCLPTVYPYGCQHEWAFVYTEQQHAQFGTLFLVLNDGGDPKRGRGYFKTIDGDVVDRFTIRKD